MILLKTQPATFNLPRITQINIAIRMVLRLDKI